MKTHWITRLAAAGLMAASGSACSLIGPSCIARQQEGTVATLHDEVAAGQVTSHLVRYETEGSQNNAQISWDGQSSPEAPRLRIHATRAECTDFQAPPAVNTGACAVLASAGWNSIGIASMLIVTHGRGNPEVLGSTAEYKIWVVGDEERAARYTIAITWFFGPDC